jgi:diguanylate cyclase (GGDEF)-like protein/PAS domain S-box-containing protein
MMTRTTHFLSLGFGLVLLLAVAGVVGGVSYVTSIHERTEQQVAGNIAKSELIGQMRTILLERIVLMHRLVDVQDPFEQDATLLRFQETAGEFIGYRNAFLDLPLSPTERGEFERALGFVRVNEAFHHRLLSLVEARRMAEAKNTLLQEDVAAQNELLEAYSRMARMQSEGKRRALEEEERSLSTALRTLGAFGLLAMLLGSAIAVLVTRRTVKAEGELLQQKERAKVTLHSIADAVITADAAANVEYLNPVAEYLTGWSLEEAQGRALQDVFRVVSEITHAPFRHPAYDLQHDERAVGLDSHTLLVSRDGREFAIEDSVAPIRGDNGETVGAVLVFHDVTEARSMARQLSWQAGHDPLTGLLNRREFESRLKTLLVSAKGESRRHALLYIDLDQFKVVNDTCGHMAGDELLRQLTVVLQESMHELMLLARLGGDEFGVLLEDCSLDSAQAVAERLLESVQGFRFVWEDKVFTVGTSIGLVAVDEDSRDIATLLSAADAACYTAKNKGRNRIQVFRHNDVELVQFHGEMEWVARITKGFEEGRLRIFFQYIKPVGRHAEEGEHYEILLRMEGEDGELIPPGAFIPAAERYNLMPSLDRWVIRRTFETYRAFAVGEPERCLDTISINISGTSLVDEYFLEFVRDHFRLYEVPPCVVCFEITETAAIANLQNATRFIRELRALGCRFALDDFGSGMSSFAYLKSLDVDYLKIDGAFVRDMVNDSVDYAMVEAINRVGHVMGLQTIAEFVETDAILDKLEELGVDFAQGYAIHKPAPFVRTPV